MFRTSLFLFFLANALSSLKSCYSFIDYVNFKSSDDFACCLGCLRDIKVVADFIIQDLERTGDCFEVQDKD